MDLVFSVAICESGRRRCCHDRVPERANVVGDSGGCVMPCSDGLGEGEVGGKEFSREGEMLDRERAWSANRGKNETVSTIVEHHCSIGALTSSSLASLLATLLNVFLKVGSSLPILSVPFFGDLLDVP